MTEISPAVFEKHFSRRAPDTHKGDFGRALCVVGSYGMAGAAILSITAALRSGAGICEGLLPDKIYPMVTQSIPEAVFTPVKTGENGMVTRESLPVLVRRMHEVDAVLLGCGMGVSPDTGAVTRACIENNTKSLVIDADGINAVAEHIDLLEKHPGEIIMTPHPGEMSRLTGESTAEIQSHRTVSASRFALRHNVFLVLKGHRTVVALPDGSVCENPTGNPGMATGGSGDVLAGILVSLLAQGIPPVDAVRAGVYIHGLAGDIAALRMSQRGMLPQDIIRFLPQVFLKLER